jgi:hypothetical protein
VSSISPLTYWESVEVRMLWREKELPKSEDAQCSVLGLCNSAQMRDFTGESECAAVLVTISLLD